MSDHALRYPDARPSSIVLDGVRGPASRSAHGVRLDALATGRVHACGVAS